MELTQQAISLVGLKTERVKNLLSAIFFPEVPARGLSHGSVKVGTLQAVFGQTRFLDTNVLQGGGAS